MVNLSFECVSTKNITFRSEFNDSSHNTASITIVVTPVSLQGTVFHLIYRISISTSVKGTGDGIVECIDIGSQKPVHTWRVNVRGNIL